MRHVDRLEIGSLKLASRSATHALTLHKPSRPVPSQISRMAPIHRDTVNKGWLLLAVVTLGWLHPAAASRLLKQQIMVYNPGQPVVAFSSTQGIRSSQAYATATRQIPLQQGGSLMAGSSLPGLPAQDVTQQYGPQQLSDQQPQQQQYTQQYSQQPQQYGQQPQQVVSNQGPGAPGCAGDVSSDPELQTTLDMHNQFRARHQVDPLCWSSDLQANAQQWADQCVFQHSGPGENLAQYFQSFRDVTQAWYNEVSNYSYDGQFSETTGHFTQMVWKGSTKLGCGYNTGCQLYVCHYAPSGNVLGSFQDNVFPPAS